MKTTIDSREQAGLPACCGGSTDILPEKGQSGSNSDLQLQSAAQITLAIDGMTCGSCASKVQTALQKIDGVQNVRVISADSTARISYDTRQTNPNEMVSALEAAGYRAVPGPSETSAPEATRPGGWLKGPVLWGATAALAVIAFYLGLITVTSDWSNATYQFSQYGGWVAALAAGLSLQVGLFVRMRSMMAGMHAKGAGKGLAASGSMSGVAMALCCSHYLATILPAIGLPFLSGAVAGIAQYQTAFFIIGVISNILGLAYMLRVIMRNGMIRLGAAY